MEWERIGTRYAQMKLGDIAARVSGWVIGAWHEDRPFSWVVVFKGRELAAGVEATAEQAMATCEWVVTSWLAAPADPRWEAA